MPAPEAGALILGLLLVVLVVCGGLVAMCCWAYWAVVRRGSWGGSWDLAGPL